MTATKMRRTKYIRPGLIIFCACVVWCISMSAQTRGFDQEREQMVAQQIQRRGITHAGTLKAMRKVERHLFVQRADRAMAYDDHPIPIGYGQTISQPYIVALMTEIIQPEKAHRVLEIGTGSGYQAAVLAEIVDSVYTIEIVKELHMEAEHRLRTLGYGNVLVRNADGYFGWDEYGPFDAIVVTAAAEYVPPPLIKQLKEGGKMIIPIGSPFLVQELMLIEIKDGRVRTRKLMPVRFVPFKRANQ